MDGLGESSASTHLPASVTISNLCRAEIESTRVFLRRKRTVFDSAVDGPLRRFLVALDHQDDCVRFRIVLERTDDGEHVFKVLIPGGTSIGAKIGKKELVFHGALTNGVKLSHGDFVEVYYKLGGNVHRKAGPFAFEYLARDEMETQNQEPGVDPEPSNEGMPGKKQPLHFLQLPEEVIRAILSEVPSREVVGAVSMVCQDLNKIVRNGIPFKRFEMMDFTVDQTAALGRMIESAPPISTAIDKISFNANNEPTEKTRFFVDRLTKGVEVLKINIRGRDSNPVAVPKLKLSRLLSGACIRRLKYLEITGCFELQVENDCCFENLEELWIHGGAPVSALSVAGAVRLESTRYSSAAFFGPQGEAVFPKLTSLGLVGEDTDDTSGPALQQWLRDVRACPFERVQIHCGHFSSGKFPIAARSAKTLKVQFWSYSEKNYCESLKKMDGLENLAISFFAGTGGKRCLESAPPSIKILQLRVPRMRVELLEIIFKRFSDLEFLCIRFEKLKDQIDEETVKRLAENSIHLQGMCFQHERSEVTVLRNDLVGERLQRTEDFWAKKIRRVFGPLDYVAGSVGEWEFLMLMDVFDPPAENEELLQVFVFTSHSPFR